jgi:hypothetical protein
MAALPCPLGSLPSSYLGLPLTLFKPRKVELQEVIDRLACKLPLWKGKLLTREGQLAAGAKLAWELEISVV